MVRSIMVSNQELKARIFGVGMINPKDRYKKLEIKDIPIMITEDGKLLCIPNVQEVKHIGCVGMTGTCKSVFMNGLLSWDYWLGKRDCINFNDFQKETFEWSLPANSYQDKLDKINAKSCGKPMVYVFPSTRTLKIETKDKRFPLLKITLPMEEVINNIEYYHSLDKTKLYLGNIKDELKECNSITEIRSVLDENFPEKGQGGMKFKLLNVFESLFKNQILNVAVPEAPAFLEYQDKHKNVYYNNVIQTLVRAGFIPSIQTSDLRNYEYFSAYMAFLAESIYRNQYEDPYFRKRTISLYVDEIDKTWMGHKGHLVKSALNVFGTNGRAARVGIRWSTQHYNSITEQIGGNTKYLFVSRLPDSKAVGTIRRDFNIPKSMDKEILNLVTDPKKGIFEMVALTTEKFILYDLLNGTTTESSDAHKGYLIPPMSRHMVPNKPI